MRDLGLNIGNSILALGAALVLGVVAFVLMMALAGLILREGFAWAGFALYFGLPGAALSVVASFVIFMDKLNHP